ncbi:MAG: FadR family transcriptional regulator [Rhizobium sp.]|nr:MAG: FadR family transcriptional regulator [Rhizobium sp.]
MKQAQDAMTSPATPGSKLIVTQSPFDAFVRKYGTIPRRGVFGYFVHELGRRIVRADYPVGTTLPNEPDLVEQFGISRTVIREAMKCLAGKGLVEIKTRVGTRVKERSNWHHLDTDVMVWYYETGPSVEIMRSIKDLRLALEPEATARAALRRTESDIDAISSAYEEMTSTIGDVNSNADADLRFHTAIFAATHNMIYSQLIDLIAVGIYANRTLSDHEDIAEGQRRSLPLHKAILDAIVAQDTNAAIKASRNLLDEWLARDYGF